MFKVALFSFFILLGFPLSAQETTLDSLLSVLGQSKEDTNKVKILYRISDIYRTKYQYETAINYTQQSLQLSKKLNFKKYTANNLGVLGIIYTNLGNYNESLNYHLKSLAIREKLDDLLSTSNSYNNVGDVYYQLGNYPTSLEYHFSALKLREKLGNKTSLANSFNNIGAVYNALNDYEKSIEYHLLSLNLREEIGLKTGIAMSYNNIAINYSALKQYEKALEYHEKALELQDKSINKKSIAITTGNIGNIYYYLKNYEKAEEYYQKSLQIREEIKDKKGIGSAFYNLANVYIKQGNTDKAKEYLDKSFALNQETQNIDDLKDAYFNYSNLYAAQGNYKDALESYKNYILYRDSIFNTDNEKKSLKAQIQYEFDKQQALNQAEFEKQHLISQAQLQEQLYQIEKQEQSYFILEQADKLKALELKKSALELQQSETERKHIELTAQKNAEQNQLMLIFAGSIVFFMLLILGIIGQSLRTNKKKNAIISQNLEEKELLLKEIHHRVKNNLQVISSLLSLQARHIKDASALAALQESQARVHTIGLLHKEIYQHEVLKNIDAQRYLEGLIDHLRNTYDPQRQVNFVLEIEKIFLTVDILISLGLISNELLTNSFKYGCTHSKPKIVVKLKQNQQNIIFSVSDNGKGYANDLDIDKSNTLGYKLVQMFAKKLQAEMQTSNQNGTSTIITFKQL